MGTKPSLSFLCKYLNKFETDIGNYVVPNLYKKKYEEIENEEDYEEEKNEMLDNFMTFQECPEVVEPKICTWLYMDKNELELYLNLSTKRRMREVIDRKIPTNPKGAGRIVLVEFMLNVTLFCKTMEFNLEQTSALLSMYYLTHKHFTDHLYVCAEEIYKYFKDYLMLHSLLFPPTNIKIFDLDKCKKILLHFCTLYLRHLPLIRLLTLPNFGFELTYELEPEPKREKDKGKKGKDKKEKKGKK